MRTGTLLLTVIPLVATAIVIRLGVREHLPSSPGAPKAPVEARRSDRPVLSLLAARAAAGQPKSQTPSPRPTEQSGLSPLDEIESGKIMTGGAIIPAPLTRTSSELIWKVEMHPGFRGWLGSEAPGGYIRDAALHGGWDRPVMLRQAHASPSPAPTQPVILNDWSPQKHGPSSPPGDLQRGHGNHLPGFPGVFDRDLLHRHGVDRAPLVPLSGNSPPPQR